MQNVESFYNELTPILEKIKESPDAFLEGTEVSKVTLWRWTNGINRKYPDPHKLLSLLSKISGKSNPKDVLNHFSGEISNFLSKKLNFLFDEKMEVNIEDNQNEIFKDYHSFLIFILCETEAGSTKTELINTLGNLAFKKLGVSPSDITNDLIQSYSTVVEIKIAELESMGVIEIREDGKYHTKIKEIVFNSETIFKYYPEIISNYRRESDEYLGYHGLFGYQQTIPEKLAQEIKIETKEFFLKCYKKMKENKCKNGIPYQVINFSDRLIFDNLMNAGVQ